LSEPAAEEKKKKKRKKKKQTQQEKESTNGQNDPHSRFQRPSWSRRRRRPQSEPRTAEKGLCNSTGKPPVKKKEAAIAASVDPTGRRRFLEMPLKTAKSGWRTLTAIQNKI